MNALNLLEQQHREAEKLFSKLEKADLDDKEEIFDDLADKLAIHTAIEEKHFYPASLEAEPDTEELLRAAVEEHLGVKRIISDLLETDAADPSFDAKVEVLKEQVRHHVEEEEKELFPKVKKAMGASKLDALGEVMENMAASLEGTEPRNDIPRQTIAAAPVESEGPPAKVGRRAA